MFVAKMNPDQTQSRAFQNFTKIIVFFAVLLIWWGAATTTKQAGMAFADWPLSFGSINPDGWLHYMVPFLEHSHRLIATLVGLLVLAMFSWSYIRSGKRALEVFLVVISLAVVFAVFIIAGAEREDAARKSRFLLLGTGLSLIPIGWLIWSWAKRSWNLVQKLSALALLMVTTQAILGGLRVTEISNGFAVLHGCFAQAFFCVLILIVLAASNNWESQRFIQSAKSNRLTKLGGSGLVFLISMQLILGASMRHFHRFGLADTDLLTTQGEWIPNLTEPIIAVMFFHKATAFLILIVVAVFAVILMGKAKKPARYLFIVLALLGIQIALGISVIATGKHFWLTNIHVLNGLAILAVVFVFAVKSWRGRIDEPSLA